MKRTSIVLLAIAVAFVISIGIPDGMSRAQGEGEVDVGITLLEIVGATGDPPTITTEITPDAPELTIVKKERITHSVPVGQVLHFQWFPPPGMTWHCDRTKVPPEHGENVECTVSFHPTESKVQDARVKFWGLLVCVDFIAGASRVDCSELKDAFKNLGGDASKGWFEDPNEAARLKTLEGPAATKQKIKEALEDVQSKAQPGDEVVFFWSSHGQCDAFPDAGDEDPGGDEGVGAADGSISDDELTEWLSGGFKSSVTLTVMVNACHSGGLTDGSEDLPSITDNNGNPLGPGHLEMLMSSTVDESSYSPTADDNTGDGTAQEPRRSVFARYLVECLKKDGGKTLADKDGNKDGVTTSKELHDCASPKVTKWVKDELDPIYDGVQEQHPEFQHNMPDPPPCPNVPPFTFDPEVGKCTRIVPNSTRVVTTAPARPGIINTCKITEGPGGHGEAYTIKDCDLDYEKTLPAGKPETESEPGVPNFEQAQPWHKVVKDSRPGSHEITECVTIQPEAPFVDPNQENNRSCITFVIKQVGSIGGATSYLDAGSGTSAGAWAALGGGLAAVLSIMMAGGWYARRRWLGNRS